jgi:probable FeS assembly SUF system protein SufT
VSANSHEPITLRRDCAVVLIPSGQPTVLRRGDRVVLIQSLGGNITMQTDRGYLVRVERNDADALGLDVSPIDATSESERRGNDVAPAPFDLEQVTDQLRTVFDPEIPVNVVDLGLVYRCELVPLDDGRYRVEIDMSVTAPGCGMGDLLREEARAKVLALRGVADVSVELVWDPPWGTSRLSEAARLELGLW